MITLNGARVVTSRGVADDVAVTVQSGLITAVGPSAGGGTDLGGGYLVPGFIDVHCHGGAGADFASDEADQAERAVRMHAEHGTTGLLTSLVAGPVDQMLKQIDRLAVLVEDDGPVLGVHLEGPFLAEARCGAQNPAHLVPPAVDVARQLTASGLVRMMTLAPELPGALDVISGLLDAGVVAAVGHTDATYAQSMAAFEAGARVATHLFNGMRPIHHREPGPVLAALDAGVICEVINDGHHVHEAVLRLVDPDALVLVTDAISAAGGPDGPVNLGGQAVDVSGGVARLRSNGSLAGSTLTMDAAFRRAVQVAGLSLEAAVRAASTTPARLLGLSAERGDIAAGMRADLVHLSDDLQVQAVMAGGKWLR